MSATGRAIWTRPVLILAGLTAIAAVLLALGTGLGKLPADIFGPVHWGLAAASITFSVSRIIVQRAVTSREIELIVLAGAAFVVPGLVAWGGLIALGALIALIVTSFV
jgi:hypothetical protein